MTRLSALMVLLSLATVMPGVVSAVDDPRAADRDERMAWWREARFGMFIHWGLYAIPAGEWGGQQYRFGEWVMHYGRVPVAEYAALAERFHPTAFDADAIAHLAKAAGMRYIVFTAKHHDGFAMYHSRVSPFNIIDATPFDRDPLAELAEACRRHGLKLGIYFSHAQDWHHPGAGIAGRRWDPAQEGDMDEFIRDIAVPQLRELLTNYGDVAVLWWDTPRDMNADRARQFLPVLDLQPHIITNNRLAPGFPGDFNTPEGHIPEDGFPSRDWETCMTMNRSWGYAAHDDDWKSTATLVRMLVETASKGGNFLLNIGPRADGSVPEVSIERLKEVGTWLEIHGESVYGTTASPFRARPWGFVTTRAGNDVSRLYLHIADWPNDGGDIDVPIRNDVIGCFALADPQRRFDYTRDDEGGLVIRLTGETPDATQATLVLELGGPPDPMPLTVTPDADGVLVLDAGKVIITNRGDARARLERVDRETLNIGFWASPRATAEWSIRVDRPGDYEVQLVMAAPGNSSFSIRVGDFTLPALPDATGSFTQFETRSLGRVALPAGTTRLSIEPDPTKWRAINVRQVILTPLD
jgi:alpha-L-fucosidase